MHPIAMLLHVDADELSAWLRQLAAVVAEEQTLNPLRPQCPPLTVCQIEPHYLPLFLRHGDAHYWGLYTQPPGPSAPFGKPILLAAGRRQHSGQMHVLVYRYPEFPLEAEEVIWLMDQSFPHLFRRWSVLLDLDLTGVGEPAPYRPGELPAGALAAIRSPKRAGAPSLACNRWLKAQIAQLPDPHRYHALMAEWLVRYEAERGRAPADKRGSFKAAARSALAELGMSGNGQ